ncbi:hypothetical protein UA08_04993 [Talaromyces atroroseus]|uniref:Zn(2)-C6 fungal-type domain-containing protein n=1 Tax=Talaromyces atroroseus TaxID=1441469 RepID=A0A225AX08_TALAT|nr:hypothetical protein UA08_04993 [Talaromyces atroroseus]OKL59516.1 hypothetical protein UA08_04993 [Talaromyces atroroseus]
MVEIKYRASCDSCLRSKVKCSQTKPACSRCTQHGHQCVYSQYRKIGRPSHKTLAEQRKRKKPNLHQQSPVVAQPDDSTVQDCVHLDAIPALDPGDTTAASSDVFDIHAEISLPCDSSVFNMSASEQLDWTDLDNLLKSSTTLQPPEDAMSISLSNDDHCSPQAGIGNFTGNIPQSPRAVLENSQLQQSEPFARRRIPSTPRDRVLPNRHHSDFSESVLSIHQARSSEYHQMLLTRTPTSKKSSLSIFRPNNFPAYPSSFDTRCTLQCHASLANQLAYITECQASKSELAFDTLLNLDDNICMERIRILSCPSCMEKSCRAQTLMLLTMVVGNLLNLFENNIGSRNNSERGSRDTGNSNKPSPFLYTPRSLTIGDITVDDTIKAALSLRLLRTYLEEQVETVTHLDHLRLEAEDKDVGFKVTGDLVGDVRRRARYLLGIVVFAHGTDPVSVTRVVALDSNSQN